MSIGICIICVLWVEVIVGLFLWSWSFGVITGICSSFLFNHIRVWWEETGGLDKWLMEKDNEENEER
jgi:hypothetical protein